VKDCCFHILIMGLRVYKDCCMLHSFDLLVPCLRDLRSGLGVQSAKCWQPKLRQSFNGMWNFTYISSCEIIVAVSYSCVHINALTF
jgi:hypothetical protein